MAIAVVPHTPVKPTLDELAHEINVRFQKGEDQRLSASIKLAEAKARCEEEGISFKAWVAEKIKFVSYIEATRLAKIGAADDPAKAIEDMRQKGRQRKADHDTKKVALRNATPAPPSEPQPRLSGKDATSRRVRDAILALAGLPPPSTVVGYLRGTDDAILVDERLATAASWLAEFAELWAGDAEIPAFLKGA